MRNFLATACITGATSGIGKCFALRFAEKGYDLILTGRRKEILLALAEHLETTFRIKVKTLIGDLCDQRFRYRIIELLKNEPGIEVLINNAGFGIDKDFCKITPEEVGAMVQTHVEATVAFCHAILPNMIMKRRGIIINVASLGAFIPGITRCLYMSTKSFMHAFSVGLSMEMAPYGIRIQSLCPGMTKTDFHRHKLDAGTHKQLKNIRFMTAEQVVDTSLRNLGSKHVLCIPGFTNNFFYLLARLLPNRILQILSQFRSQKVQKNMSNTKSTDPFSKKKRRLYRDDAVMTKAGKFPYQESKHELIGQVK
ncbi:MAG: SDR family NAD(P)-dependent oxidoreductase, partial [bacterium]